MKDSTFQRAGAISNTHVGREFEDAVKRHFEGLGISLTKNFGIPIGHDRKKKHRFDLGSDDPAILVECKANTWTKSGKRPSAKIRGMNEVMFHFHLAPSNYRKILFVLKHLRPQGKGDSLGTHYVRTQGHLIGEGIEVWQFDLTNGVAEKLR